MTPTLIGRIHTRLALLATVGFVWTIIVSPFLPRAGASYDDVFEATVVALIVVALVGVGWEYVYHQIQQYRWEKDWPIIFGLLTGIPEGILAFLLVDGLREVGPAGSTFTVHFVTTWVVVWLFANGPMRVVLLRWRFVGGKVM